MPLTRDFRITIQKRNQRDPAFCRALLQGIAELILADDTVIAKKVMRDYINATIGFEELARNLDKLSKSLMRMFSRDGNPQLKNLSAVIHCLQKKKGIRLEVKARDLEIEAAKAA